MGLQVRRAGPKGILLDCHFRYLKGRWGLSELRARGQLSHASHLWIHVWKERCVDAYRARYHFGQELPKLRSEEWTDRRRTQITAVAVGSPERSSVRVEACPVWRRRGRATGKGQRVQAVRTDKTYQQRKWTSSTPAHREKNVARLCGLQNNYYRG